MSPTLSTLLIIGCYVVCLVLLVLEISTTKKDRGEHDTDSSKKSNLAIVSTCLLFLTACIAEVQL